MRDIDYQYKRNKKDNQNIVLNKPTKQHLSLMHFVWVHHCLILNLFEATKFMGPLVYIGNLDYPIGRKYQK